MVKRILQTSSMLPTYPKLVTQHRFSAYISNQQALKHQANDEFRRVKKRLEDPMSHRIIEKRRRDRMNNCLADLSRLIPAEYLKKGRGRIEKTEIIEMAIKHMKHLQALTCNGGGEACDTSDNIHVSNSTNEKQFVNGTKVLGEPELSSTDHYKLGYQECLAETMRFLVELQGFFPTDTLCVKLINHLQRYFEKLAKGEKLMTSIRESVVLQPSEFERKANEYHRMTVEVGRNVENSVSNSINSDDSYQENTLVDGHLQDMHAGSHYSSLYLPSASADVNSQSSPESSSSQQDLNDAQSSSSSMYKFKNYIRERFEHSNPEKPAIPSVVVCSRKRRADSTNTLNTSPPIPEHLPKCTRPVPIFALHAKGSFYVPLTIDSHLLSPFGTELNGDYGIQGFSPLLLHPVTISVNFNRPLLQSSPSTSPILSSNLSLPASLPNGPMLMVSECR